MRSCEEVPAGKCKTVLGSLVGLKIHDIRNVDLTQKSLTHYVDTKLNVEKFLTVQTS